MENGPIYCQIGIIGTGRVARAVALALGRHSSAPALLWGRNRERLEAAVAQIGHAEAVSHPEAILTRCDLIAIAVSDDAVAPLALDLAARVDDLPTPFVFHVSGRSGAAILDPLREKGALTAAIHPVMTFTGDPQSELRRMADARFAITGVNAEAVAAAEHVVHLLGGVPVEITEDRRALYHAGLCHAANHLVTLLAGSSHALVAAGVDDPGALLAPLVRAALENSLSQGFAALSGPLLRGDQQTITDHLTALDSHCPQLLFAYRAMALATLDALEESGLHPVAPALRDNLG